MSMVNQFTEAGNVITVMELGEKKPVWNGFAVPLVTVRERKEHHAPDAAELAP